MQINIIDSVLQTNIFMALLLLAVVLTVKKRTAGSQFDITFTNELKGVAILMVIFSHVGYFLSTDHRFLYPLSVVAGKGVDIFLFLSGFGLTISALKSSTGVKDFYLKRLKKLFIPMWLVLAVFFVLDAVVLHRFYPFSNIVQNILGFFSHADLYQDLNSPLWYFTLILFYYLLFPLVFSKRLPVISAGLLLLLGYFLVNLNLPVSAGVLGLYKLHYLAFPLGMCLTIILQYLEKHPIKLPSIPRTDALVTKFIAIIVALYLFGFLAINSGVGGIPIKEQAVSLVAVGCLLVMFFLKSHSSRFLTLLGAYSYEIYLLHWPLMSRYDFLYTRLPASLATFLYLVILLILGVVLKKLTNRFADIIPVCKVLWLQKSNKNI